MNETIKVRQEIELETLNEILYTTYLLAVRRSVVLQLEKRASD